MEPASGESRQTTLERPPGYDLVIEQPARGYRYNQDPFHLARFIAQHAEEWRTRFAGECLDLGCGVGVLALVLARIFPETRFTGIEIQPELADLARANCRRNRLEQRIQIITADYRDFSRQNSNCGRFSTVVSNPPYYPAAGGRLNHCPQKRLARHELAGDLADLARNTARLLAPKGSLLMVFPAERLFELSYLLQQHKLEPKHLKLIHPQNSDRAATLLLAARKNSAPGVIIENPLQTG
ncbi:MAG: methyltransferase [Deltaproteobacteria bacterium]|nr:methyltransferase [Deltaproteobacteria bacterium]